MDIVAPEPRVDTRRMRREKLEMLPSQGSFLARVVDPTTQKVVWKASTRVRRSSAAPNREADMKSFMADQSRWPRPSDGVKRYTPPAGDTQSEAILET